MIQKNDIELRRRVDEYFRITGRRQRDCWQMYLKTAILAACCAVSYVLLVLVAQTWLLGWWKRQAETSVSNTWSTSRSEQVWSRIFVGCDGWHCRIRICLDDTSSLALGEALPPRTASCASALHAATTVRWEHRRKRAPRAEERSNEQSGGGRTSCHCSYSFARFSPWDSGPSPWTSGASGAAGSPDHQFSWSPPISHTAARRLPDVPGGRGLPFDVGKKGAVAEPFVAGPRLRTRTRGHSTEDRVV